MIFEVTDRHADIQTDMHTETLTKQVLERPLAPTNSGSGLTPAQFII